MTLEEKKAEGYAALIRAMLLKSGTSPLNPADWVRAAYDAGWNDREKAIPTQDEHTLSEHHTLGDELIRCLLWEPHTEVRFSLLRNRSMFEVRVGDADIFVGRSVLSVGTEADTEQALKNAMSDCYKDLIDIEEQAE